MKIYLWSTQLREPYTIDNGTSFFKEGILLIIGYLAHPNDDIIEWKAASPLKITILELDSNYDIIIFLELTKAFGRCNEKCILQHWLCLRFRLMERIFESSLV
jgi:hypothetical protein